MTVGLGQVWVAEFCVGLFLGLAWPEKISRYRREPNQVRRALCEINSQVRSLSQVMYGTCMHKVPRRMNEGHHIIHIKWMSYG
jgi:hypothetical protein